MHLIIADRIADRLSIKDKTTFLLGGIAPDAAIPKDSSHYFRGDRLDYTRHIAYQEFLHKYEAIKDNHYILGYYTHLIADDLWVQGFYLSWLKNRIESDENVSKAYYNDFKLLNGKLLDHYGYKDEFRELLKISSEVIDLEEVSGENVQNFIPYVIEDMAYDPNDIHEELKVFTLEQIIGYIETAVDKGIIYIKSQLSH